MVNRLKGLIRWLRRLFKVPVKPEGNIMAEYDGVHCKVYLTNGARLVGTVHVLGTPGWVRIEGSNKSTKLKVSQISSVVTAL